LKKCGACSFDSKSGLGAARGNQRLLKMLILICTIINYISTAIKVEQIPFVNSE
jgi:hypothetical protein